jgi:hypothetical protein
MIRFQATLKMCIFTLLTSFTVLRAATTLNNGWIHYLPQGYIELEMNDLYSVGNDIYAAGRTLLIPFCNADIISCATDPQPLLANKFFSLMLLRTEKEVWLLSQGTSPALYRYKFPEFELIDSMTSEPVPQLTNIIKLRNGTLLAGTLNSGLITYDGSTWNSFPGSPVGVSTIPRLEDQSGNLWVVSGGDGFYKCENTSGLWKHYSTANSALTSNYISSIIDDTNGNVIISTDEEFSSGSQYSSGIFLIKGASWTKFDTSNAPIPTSNVQCMARDSTGNIWFGSRWGVFKWDGNTSWKKMYTTSINDYHQPSGYIRDILVDGSNRVWVATFHYGFYMLDQNHWSCNPELSITNPNQPFTVKQNQVIIITWEYKGPIGAVKLEYRIGQNSWTVIQNNVNNNRKSNWVISTLKPSDKYQIKISSVENPAVFDTSARFTIVDTGVNIPPELTPLPDTIEVKTNQKTTFTIHAKDVDKDTLRFNFSALPDWVTSKDSVITFEPKISSQSFTFNVTVSDGNGGTVKDSMVVVVSIPTENLKKSTTDNYKCSLLRNGTGKLVLQLHNNSASVTASLYNLTGQKVGEFKNEGNQITFSSHNSKIEGRMFLLLMDVLSEAGRSRIIQKVMLQ